MNFETLVQELSNAYPWTLDKVEKIIGKKLERPANLPSSRTEYKAKDVAFDDGLVIGSVEIRASHKTQELLTVELWWPKGDSSCITAERLKKTYPLSHPTLIPAIPIEASKTGYSVSQPWGGGIRFVFENRDEKCLSYCIISALNLKTPAP